MALQKETLARLTREYKESKYFGVLEHPEIQTEVTNPSCGDAISFTIALHDNIITDIKFKGVGCIINQATASLLCARVKGSSLEDVLRLSDQDILALINLELGPTRLRCATLPLQALHDGIKGYIRGHLC